MNDLLSLLHVAGGLLLSIIILVALLTTTFFSLFNMLLTDLKKYLLNKKKGNLASSPLQMRNIRYLSRVNSLFQQSKLAKF